MLIPLPTVRVKGERHSPKAVILHDLDSSVMFFPSTTVTDSGGSKTSIRGVHA